MTTTVNPKSFKELVQSFKSICESQLAVKHFQLGEPSDIDMQTNIAPFQRYPFVFLTPEISSMDRYGKMSLGFTLVVADIVRNEEQWQIDTYNSTLMILQDILSKIIMSPASEIDYTVQTPVIIDPFVESYNNNLAGWTAALTIDIKSPFDLCNAAF
jgi:hypothetical protein